MPKFNEKFILECDASNTGVGAVLMQGGHPIAYISQGLEGHFNLRKGDAGYLITYPEVASIPIGKTLHHTGQKFLKFLLDQRF